MYQSPGTQSPQIHVMVSETDMNTIKLTKTQIEVLIETLQSAVNVCDSVDPTQKDDSEKTYPFACGYSRAAMLHALNSLNIYLDQ